MLPYVRNDNIILCSCPVLSCSCQEARDLIKLDIHGRLLSNRALIEASKKASPEAKDGETRTTGTETSCESIKSNFDSESADRSSTLHDEGMFFLNNNNNNNNKLIAKHFRKINVIFQCWILRVVPPSWSYDLALSLFRYVTKAYSHCRK